MHTIYNNTHNTCKNESKHSEMDPVRQNPIQRTVRSVHNMCASHSAQLLHAMLHRTDMIIFPLTLQTITTAPMMSISGKRVGKWNSWQDFYGDLAVFIVCPLHMWCYAFSWLCGEISHSAATWRALIYHNIAYASGKSKKSLITTKILSTVSHSTHDVMLYW